MRHGLPGARRLHLRQPRPICLHHREMGRRYAASSRASGGISANDQWLARGGQAAAYMVFVELSAHANARLPEFILLVYRLHSVERRAPPLICARLAPQRHAPCTERGAQGETSSDLAACGAAMHPSSHPTSDVRTQHDAPAAAPAAETSARAYFSRGCTMIFTADSLLWISVSKPCATRSSSWMRWVMKGSRLILPSSTSLMVSWWSLQ